MLLVVVMRRSGKGEDIARIPQSSAILQLLQLENAFDARGRGLPIEDVVCGAGIMLDRERNPSPSVGDQVRPIAKQESLVTESLDDQVDEQEKTRVHRTTIVPQPLDELDESPLHMAGRCQFELDDPDLDDPDLDDKKLDDKRLDEPKQRARSESLRSDRPAPLSAVAASVALGATAERLILPPPRLPAQASKPPVMGPSHPISEPPFDHPKSDKWYLRVQLDAECISDLWIRDRTPHNVLVWSEDMASWVPLLTVRELRDAIRDAHDAKTRDELRESNFVFVNTQSQPSDHQPLPAPRLPTGVAPLRPASTTNLWLQSKPRTISNVPPPLLTTAVPVLASVQPRPAQSPPAQPPPARSVSAQPQLVKPIFAHPLPAQSPAAQSPATQPNPVATSTVAPVVATIQPRQELDLDVVVVPEIPRPGRVPDIKEIARTATTRTRQAPTHATPAPPLGAAPSQFTRFGKVKVLLAGLPLVNLERAVWLAAGIAISSAVMLFMRDGDQQVRTNALNAPARVGQTTSSEGTTTPTPHRGSPEGAEVHRIEDLPIVSGSGTSSGSKATGVSRQHWRASTHVASTESPKLPSAANALGPSTPTPSAGSFDTGAARRVLTGSASRASRCATDGPASGSVIVTFAPSGFVQSASISGLSGKGVNVGCVLRAFQEARISPFSGEPVTVRKGFQII